MRPRPTTVPPVFPFLDLWRVVAACMVLALHFQQRDYLPQQVPDLYRVAHLGVVVFFVISGFSVSYSAQQHAGRPLPFLVARMSRLYSVVLPVLILALLLDTLGGVSNSTIYPTWQYAKWWLHLGFNLLFLGELWTYSMTPFSVIPYWSLAYEFWFYILLAATMMRPGRLRTLCVALVFVIMGPRIWALLPCWLLGVWAYRVTQGPGRLHGPVGIPSKARLWACLLFVVGTVVWLGSGIDGHLISASEVLNKSLQAFAGNSMRLDYSRWFLADYGVALIFTAALLIATREVQPPAPNALTRTVKWLAPHTFGLYLMHYTLISLSAALIPQAERQGVRSALLAAGIIAICLSLSVLFDRSRAAWAGLLELRLFR